MSHRRRRLTFQLTPLLDLLLIVIFAQFMHVQHDATELQVAIDAERVTIASRARDLELQFERQSKQEFEAYQGRVERINRQQRERNQQLADLFDLPKRWVDEVARLRDTDRPAEAQQMESAAQRIDQLLQARGHQLMQLLLRVDEMQKHVTFWELHLTTNGRVRMSDGQLNQSIAFASEAEFVTRVFQASKQLPEPRTLVLILLTFADTQARFRRDAVAGMPHLTERLRNDSGGTRWYDYSLVGYRPGGPVLSAHTSDLPSP